MSNYGGGSALSFVLFLAFLVAAAWLFHYTADYDFGTRIKASSSHSENWGRRE